MRCQNDANYRNWRKAMELINKRGKINKSTFKQIVKEAYTTHMSIKYDKVEIDTVPSQLLLDLFVQDDIPNDKDFDVHIIYDETDVVFTGKDFNWFLKDERLNETYSYVYGENAFLQNESSSNVPVNNQAKTQKRIVKQNDIKEYYHIAIFPTDIEVKDEEYEKAIEDFFGTKSDCITWLNQQIVKHANLENEVSMLICLDYEAEDLKWQTLQELFNSGKIEI